MSEDRAAGRAALAKRFHEGALDVQVLQRRRPGGAGRRDARHRRRLGLGQEHAAAPAGRARCADRGQRRADGQRLHRTARARPSRAPAQPAPRLRLPVPSPAARVHARSTTSPCRCAIRRDAAAAARERARADAGAGGPGRARAAPAGGALGRRAPARRASRARWSRSRPACSPTSRPATSTATPPTACSTLMLDTRASTAAPRSCWSRTTRRWPRAAIASCACSAACWSRRTDREEFRRSGSVRTGFERNAMAETSTDPRCVRQFRQILLWPLRLMPLAEAGPMRRHWEVLRAAAPTRPGTRSRTSITRRSGAVPGAPLQRVRHLPAARAALPLRRGQVARAARCRLADPRLPARRRAARAR